MSETAEFKYFMNNTGIISLELLLSRVYIDWKRPLMQNQLDKHIKPVSN